jgi:hypothetical protein
MADGNPHPLRYCSYESICTVCKNDADCTAAMDDDLCIAAASCNTSTGYCEMEYNRCDDSDACTTDACNMFTGECAHAPVANCCNADADCSDTNLCTGRSCDTVKHTCSFPSYHCDDYDPCTADSCDGDTGECLNTPIEFCTSECEKKQDCYDFALEVDNCVEATCEINPANGNGSCSYADLSCDDNIACTIDFCEAPYGCRFYFDENCTDYCGKDTDCNDHSLCTVDFCDPDTNTCANAATTCNDNDPCTVDFCEPTTGQCTAMPCENCDCGSCLSQEDCMDDNLCTDDLCTLGVCTHPEVACIDGDPCTLDYCNPDQGCIHEPEPKCTGCMKANDCDDGNACTIDSCNEGYCEHLNVC